MTIDDTRNCWRRRFGATLPQTTRAAGARRAAAVLAFVAVPTLAQAGSLYAASQPVDSAATRAQIHIAGAACGQATTLPLASTHVRGAMHTLAAPRPAASFKPPITVPTPLPVLPSGPVTAPGLYPLQATASSVTVTWSDCSNNELGFKVFRRDLSGAWQQVDHVATRNMPGSGTGGVGGFNYTWVDTSTDLSGQCYMIAAYNATEVGSTAEECTVRPDPSEFPQTAPETIDAWTGLSDVNDGTGSLETYRTEQYLEYGERTWGVNLTEGNSSLWRVEAQGGPHLMQGQAVALKVWGGGWLKYGHQTFGVDLQLSSTPVYEWYAIGQELDPSKGTWVGADLENDGAFRLWNSSAHAYLVPGDQTWGIGLTWSTGSVGSTPTPTPSPAPRGTKTEQVFNCATDQQPVEVWIADQTSGGGFVDQGTVNAQYGPDGCPASGSVPLTFSPLSGHQYLLVATDSALPDCQSDDPRESACGKMTVQFVGDANGYTRTDIVDVGTRIRKVGRGGTRHR